jgi:hypothetical protein
MRTAVVPVIVAGALAVALAGCSATAAPTPSSRTDQRTSIACKDVLATMTPAKGTGTIDLGPPFDRLIVAVDNSGNKELRSELAAFQAAAATGGDVATTSAAMLRTCKQLGLRAPNR